MAKKSRARLERDKMGMLPRSAVEQMSPRVMQELQRLRPGASNDDLVLWVSNMPEEERTKLGDFIIRKLKAS